MDVRNARDLPELDADSSARPKSGRSGRPLPATITTVSTRRSRGGRCVGLNKVARPANLVAIELTATAPGFRILGEWPDGHGRAGRFVSEPALDVSLRQGPSAEGLYRWRARLGLGITQVVAALLFCTNTGKGAATTAPELTSSSTRQRGTSAIVSRMNASESPLKVTGLFAETSGGAKAAVHTLRRHGPPPDTHVRMSDRKPKYAPPGSVHPIARPDLARDDRGHPSARTRLRVRQPGPWLRPPDFSNFPRTCLRASSGRHHNRPARHSSRV